MKNLNNVIKIMTNLNDNELINVTMLKIAMKAAMIIQSQQWVNDNEFNPNDKK